MKKNARRKEINKTLTAKLAENPDIKWYRMQVDFKTPHDISPTSLMLHSITGCFADEYFLPARSINNIYNVITDESIVKEHYGVSAVLMRFIHGQEIEQVYDKPLKSLCQEYGLRSIHFNKIFGENILGKRRQAFLNKYQEIVSIKDLSAQCFSSHRSKVSWQIPYPCPPKQLYFILLWNVMEKLVQRLPPGGVFHINYEQTNNFSVELGIDYLAQLHNALQRCTGLHQMLASFCRHPVFFSKAALLFSSTADLAVYSNNLLQQKIDEGVPLEKIKRRYSELIEFTRSIFSDFVSWGCGSRYGPAQLFLGKL